MQIGLETGDVCSCVRTGYKNRRTTTFSKIRESIGVTVIGLKSEQEDGDDTFGTGVMTPTFHCGGTYE